MMYFNCLKLKQKSRQSNSKCDYTYSSHEYVKHIKNYLVGLLKERKYLV